VRLGEEGGDTPVQTERLDDPVTTIAMTARWAILPNLA
jgi:hypothetical protein